MTTHLDPARVPPPPGPREDPHRSLRSEAGARPGEHPGRSKNPLVKVTGLAWLEFEKPDLDRAGRFGTDFGFTVADRTPETLVLRGRQAAAACLVVRRGPRSGEVCQVLRQIIDVVRERFDVFFFKNESRLIIALVERDRGGVFLHVDLLRDLRDRQSDR